MKAYSSRTSLRSRASIEKNFFLRGEQLIAKLVHIGATDMKWGFRCNHGADSESLPGISILGRHVTESSRQLPCTSARVQRQIYSYE